MAGSVSIYPRQYLRNPYQARTFLAGGLGDNATGYDTGEGNVGVTAPIVPAASAPATNWTALLTQATGAIAQVGTSIATARINTLYGPKASNLVGQAAQALPIVNGNARPAPAKHPYMPWIIGGGAAIALLGLVLVLKKR